MTRHTPTDGKTDRIRDLIERIKPILAGQGADVQGAVLADLLSIWLVSHPAEIRDELLLFHVAAVRALIPTNEHLRSERMPSP